MRSQSPAWRLRREDREGWRARRATGNMIMVRLKSEIEVTCPCCQATLVVDTNLGRVVSTKEPDRGNKPELSDAQRILADEAARREAIFQQSVDSEKTRGDALSRRFEEALKQAREEPVTRPARDFDLD
jgi:GTP cyclohydrolase FolE2